MSITILVGKKKYTCKKKGQKINLTEYTGYINCPDPVEFCMHEADSCPQDCNMRGRCTKQKKCFCFHGFSGTACETKGGKGGFS